jgi:dihydrofolate reductase
MTVSARCSTGAGSVRSVDSRTTSRGSGKAGRGRGNARTNELLDQLRAANRGGDVHLIGGPRTIETFRALGALDKLELVVLPFLVGAGMRLTDALNVDTGLEFESTRALPGGSVEIVCRVRSSGAIPAVHETDWAPASQRHSGI